MKYVYLLSAHENAEVRGREYERHHIFNTIAHNMSAALVSKVSRGARWTDLHSSPASVKCHCLHLDHQPGTSCRALPSKRARHHFPAISLTCY